MKQDTSFPDSSQAVFPISNDHPQRRALNMPDGFTSHFLKTGEIHIHYVEGGHGHVVVLLHGWPATWWIWRKVMPGLIGPFHVIAIDLPG